MKAYKIKKRSHRQAFFISGESVTSYPRPKLPLFYFSKIHPPALFKRGSYLPVVVEAMSQEAEETFVAAAAQVKKYLPLVAASETVEKVVGI